jgi:hypothetical protein
MLRKILWVTSIALLTFIVLLTTIKAMSKPVEPPQNARMIAEKKAKTGVNCTPATNKNCWALTPSHLQQIKKIQDGLLRKKDR